MFKACYYKQGYKGYNSIYTQVTNHYQQRRIYKDISNQIYIYKACQKQDARQFKKAARQTYPFPQPFAKQHLDIQYILLALKGKKYYLLKAQDNLIGFVEASILPNKLAGAVYSFILRAILLRQGLPKVIVIDRGSKFKGEAQKILEELSIKRITILLYNLRTNRINEVRHVLIIASLTKMTDRTGKGQQERLPYMLYVDQTAIKGTIRRLPFFLVHNYKLKSLVENNVLTWRTINQDKVNSICLDRGLDSESHQKLIALRAKVLQDIEHDQAIVAERVAAAREKAAKRRNIANA